MRSMLKLLAALATVLFLATGCPVAHAQQYVMGESSMWYLGKDHMLYSLRIELMATLIHTNGEAGNDVPDYAYLVVHAAKCPRHKCGATTIYVAALATDQYDVSNFKVLKAHVGAFGTGLTVTWKGAGPAYPVDSNPTLAGTSVDVNGSWAATATVTGFGVTCVDKFGTASRHTEAAPTAWVPPPGKPPPFKTGTGLPPLKPACAKAPRR